MKSTLTLSKSWTIMVLFFDQLHLDFKHIKDDEATTVFSIVVAHLVLYFDDIVILDYEKIVIFEPRT